MGKFAVAAIVSSWVVPITLLVNRLVPEPYMDEIFHIPQAQQYCGGNFGSWDPMITTPPGLYYLSLAHIASLFPGFYSTQATPSFSDMCSTEILRTINGVLAVICSIILYDIITHLKPTLDDRKAMLHTVVLSLYPLHWFFTFLYYTDVASVTAVLAMYLTNLKKNYWFSALIGVFSVVIRQTNIVWVLFVACTGIIDLSLTHGKDHPRTAQTDVSLSKASLAYATGTCTIGSYIRKRKSVRSEDTVESSLPAHASPFSSSGLIDEIQIILLTLWHKKWELLVSFGLHLIILVGFLLFIHWNGSVVLGAKEAHSVTPHFAQLLYFSLVSVLALAPLHFTITQAVELLQLFWKCRPLCFFLGFLALIVGLLSVHFFSVAHPYLVADNRHYPFYLWKKVIMAHWSIKYLLVPIYICSWLSIIHMLGKFRNKIWVLAYFLATAAVLIPTPLIEFRYYTIPFYFLVLHCNINDSQSWLFTGMLYIGVNVFTMMMFLFRPFHWDHEPGIQRFIW